MSAATSEQEHLSREPRNENTVSQRFCTSPAPALSCIAQSDPASTSTHAAPLKRRGTRPCPAQWCGSDPCLNRPPACTSRPARRRLALPGLPHPHAPAVLHAGASPCRACPGATSGDPTTEASTRRRRRSGQSLRAFNIHPRSSDAPHKHPIGPRELGETRSPGRRRPRKTPSLVARGGAAARGRARSIDTRAKARARPAQGSLAGLARLLGVGQDLPRRSRRSRAVGEEAG